MTTFDYDEYVRQHSAPIHNVYQSVWKDYELLCDLIDGSDYDGDSVFCYWSETYPVSREVLNQISFEWSTDGISWKECSVISETDTVIFPGNNYVKAKAGFMLPYLSYHREELRNIGFRALVPRELVKLTSAAKNPFLDSSSVAIQDELNRPVAYASMSEGNLRVENGWSATQDELSLEIIYTVPPESFSSINEVLGYFESIPISTVLTLINQDGKGQAFWEALRDNQIPNTDRFTWLS